ncbi:hypothetical protein D9M68_997270 [compost metagenome]
MAEKLAGEIAGRRARIEHDGVAVADRRRHGNGDNLFRFAVLAHAFFERRFADDRGERHGAMHLHHGSACGQRLDVPPHGFQRNVEFFGEICDRDRTILLEKPEDVAVTF